MRGHIPPEQVSTADLVRLRLPERRIVAELKRLTGHTRLSDVVREALQCWLQVRRRMAGLDEITGLPKHSAEPVQTNGATQGTGT